MTDVREFKLPDVGEGLVEAEIVTWKVKPGDSVKVNDIIVEIETAKSLVELPSPYTGVVADLLVPEGQVVPVGTPIIRVSASGAAAAAPAPAEAEGERTKVLVGYGARTTAKGRRPRKQAAAPAQPSTQPSAQPAATVGPAAAQSSSAPPAGTVPVAAPAQPAAPAAPAGSERPAATVLAKPPVRKLAKDLGVDLRQVTPTGPNGTISRADIEAFAGAPAAEPAAPATSAAPGEGETRVPVRGLRRSTAAAVTESAFTAPHVTEWVTADVSASMELLERLRARREFADVKLSPLALVAKACCLAIRRTPELNAVWAGSDSGAEIVLRNYVNLGIAAATSRGLLVPHVKDADRMSLPELARSISELTRTAREGKTSLSDLQGTTFTITNVGVFGVDGGTPILNPGETGILAVGAIARRPWVVEVDGVEQIVPRWVTTISLSFDHRVVDGEQGSRFLTDVAGILSDPGLAMILA